MAAPFVSAPLASSARRLLRSAAAVVAVGALGACGSSDERSGEPGASAISGVYELDGVTVQAAHGRQRPVTGQLELRVDGDRYEVDFHLETTDPSEGSDAPVRVSGSGRGFIVGGVFTGTTEESVSGEGAPAAVEGLQVVSTSQARIDADGLLHVELQNWPGEGQRYSPSVTVLEGHRVGGVGEVATSPR